MDVTAKTCPHCNKVYGSSKIKNQHIKKVHKMVPETSAKKCRVICPLCEDQIELKTMENLRAHLADQHQVSCEQIIVDCSSNVDYEAWKQLHKIETSYSLNWTSQFSDHKEVHYDCNRSNNRGFESKCFKRKQKAGGSIKIRGMCPSTLTVKIYKGGKITVNYWKTHAGHEENELRRKHLSTMEKNVRNKIVEAHKKAEATRDKVSVINTEFGEFQVKTLESNTYNIKYKQFCKSNCKALFCRVCKICIHRYECNCPEYATKNILCKHVHLVRMYEGRKRTNSVLDKRAEDLGPQSQIEIQQQPEISISSEEQQVCDQEHEENIHNPKNIEWFENICNMVRSLDKEDLEIALMDKNLEEFAKNVAKMVEAKNKRNSSKRQMEQQEHFCTKKKKAEN